MSEGGRGEKLADESSEDLTGKSSILRNVAISWVGHIVFVVFGFVLPRVIDAELGQDTLGVWDFAWSIVSYMNLAMLGIGSAVNNFVASHRAVGDSAGLNRLVSSVFAVQVVIATLVAGGVFLIYSMMPIWFAQHPAGSSEDASSVVLFLGFSVVVNMALDSYRGVITGCHRWDIHNILSSVQYLCAASLMTLALLFGYGLREISQIYFLIAAGFELSRIVFVRHICPELQVKVSSINQSDIKRVFRFGAKSFVLGIVPLVLMQTVNVMLALKVGPAGLAILVRPTALLKHVEAFIIKIGHLVSPTVSSLRRIGGDGELRRFALEMTRMGWALGIPAVVFMLVYGPKVIQLWMGDAYAIEPVILIVTIGSAFTIAQSPPSRILIGLDQHGQLAKISFAMYSFVLLIGIPIIGMMGWSIIKAAILVATARFGYGIVVLPYQVSKALHMSLVDYLYRSTAQVLAIGAFCGAVLWLLREFQDASLAVELLTGAIVHGLLVLSLYWVFVLPERVKQLLWRTPGQPVQ